MVEHMPPANEVPADTVRGIMKIAGSLLYLFILFVITPAFAADPAPQKSFRFVDGDTQWFVGPRFTW